ncbi:hypothetical protein BJY00DRAFT_289563 [Aspergillus carlsbadensis]|nr:hypothetical protein BJY00DRAFT_289563 [Aspergillus carlsbadensis]
MSSNFITSNDRRRGTNPPRSSQFINNLGCADRGSQGTYQSTSNHSGYKRECESKSLEGCSTKPEPKGKSSCRVRACGFPCFKHSYFKA